MLRLKLDGLMKGLNFYPTGEDFDWNWDNQLSDWNKRCETRYVMQSPINILQRILITKKERLEPYKFKIDLKREVYFVVTNYQSEIIAQFINDAGTFTIYYKDIPLRFQPVGIYFRFPGENTIENLRHQGEIVIKLRQDEKDQVLKLFEI